MIDSHKDAKNVNSVWSRCMSVCVFTVNSLSVCIITCYKMFMCKHFYCTCRYNHFLSIPKKYFLVQLLKVLAINRGEHHKILSVKVVVPDDVKSPITRLCENKWLRHHITEDARSVISDSIEDAYNRLISGQIIRAVR